MSLISTSWFGSQLFMPHGHCYLWEPALVWLQVLSNGAIAAAYVSIFATLVYLVRRIKDIPFQWMYVAFAVFIVACGVTHIFDVLVIWNPLYWEDGAIRALTGVASVGTALMLPPLVPKAIALADAAAVAHQRGMKLEEANRELATLLVKTTELEQMKTRFFANVSHELRTPLALILGPTEELLAATNLTDAQRAALAVVQGNARALLSHVNDLLDVAKLEAGKLQAEYMECDAARVVSTGAAHFEELAKERATTFDVQVPETLPAQLDANKLHRLLTNLLSNAFKFTPEGGRVRCTLRVAHGGERLVLEVADSGPGIPPEQRNAVFERFTQLEGGITRRFGGTGLGLSIAKEFAELHGGTVSVGAADLGGALLHVELPVRAPQGVRVKHGSWPSTIDEAPRNAGSVERAQSTPAPAPVDETAPLVLVAEDNLELNRFLTRTLARSCRVASAENGHEALALARELSPDLIVTDLMMPDMGGDELLRAVRRDERLVDVPLVILTAKADDALRLQLLREGAQDYILKPFAAEELRIRAHNLIATKRARDLLRRELSSKSSNVEELVRAVSQRQRELQTALDSLRIARDKASAASDAKTRFLATVSHELRTPITTLRLQVDRLCRDETIGTNEKMQRVLMRLDTSSVRLQQLVDSLLDYARVQSGHLDVRLEQADLRALVETAVEEMRPQAEQKKLALLLEPAPERELTTVTDPKLLHLVLINLIANAIKFTKEGHVRVTVEASDTRRRVLVEDTGPGIDEADQERIFEPFEQLEPVHRKHAEGVGLGLAIVRELAAGMEARVSVQSTLGRGSLFTLEVPTKPSLAPHLVLAHEHSA